MADEIFKIAIREIPNYSGKEMPLNDYIDKINDFIALLTEADHITNFTKLVMIKMSDKPREAVKTITIPATGITWQLIKQALTAYLVKPVSTESAHGRLTRLKQSDTETVEQFGERFKKQLNVLNNSYSTDLAAAVKTELMSQNNKIAK